MEDRYSFKQAGTYFRRLFLCYLIILPVSLVAWLPYVNAFSAVTTTILLSVILATLHKLIGFSPETIWRKASSKARNLAILSFMATTAAYWVAYSNMPGIISSGRLDYRPEHFHQFVMLVLLATILGFYQMFVMIRMCVFVAERLTSKKITARTSQVHISFFVLLIITILLGIGAIVLDAVNTTAEVDSETLSSPMRGVIGFLLITYTGFLLHCYVTFLSMLKMTAVKMSTATRNLSRKTADQI